MNLKEIKAVISQVVAEAKEAGLPKSGGKLVHLKKELASLKQMKESVSQLTMNEANAQPLVAEYNHMQKYVNELEKIKEASAKLSEMLGNQVTEVEGKISAETQKIKEMMGLIEPAPKKEAKAKPSKEEPKEEMEEAEEKVEGDVKKKILAKKK
jgi:chromosome segregation ATPase